MSIKKSLSAIIVFTLCFAIIGQVVAQTTPTVNVGVSEGKTFKYQVAFFWESTDPTDTLPANLVDANATEWFQATISMVTGTTVTISTVQHYRNGSEISGDQLTDVSTGNGNSVLLYASGLNAGSYLFPLSSLPWVINSTEPREYAGATRETNYIENKMTDLEDYVYRYTSLHFDKQTGILVEAYFEDVLAETPTETLARTVKLLETNAWTAGSNGNGNGNGNTSTPWLTTEMLYVIVIVIVLVVLIVSVLLLKKRKSKAKHL